MSNARKHPERVGETVRESLCDQPESDDGNDTPAIADVSEIDPFTDEHDIDYWIWDGAVLIPATPVESERFHEREALLRLTYWQTHLHANAHTKPTRWHTAVIVVQAALAKLHARLSGHTI